MLNGIDISAWQRGIDAASVPSDFVIHHMPGLSSVFRRYHNE